ncbi:MAG TPA: histidine kinase N-terminal domain-containing protein [Chloroflexota bacterium]|nr:histidine kinase N-terminal domain-containing protein [Chloroflexota bacterium]
MDLTLNRAVPIAEDDQEVLSRVESCLPVLADLVRGDVFLCEPNGAPIEANVRAIAKPATVPSINMGLEAGSVVTPNDEPAIFRVLARGIFARRAVRTRVQGHPTVQDIYPIKNGSQVVGCLVIEVGLAESERQKRKSIVYRRAVERLRRQVVAGQLPGAGNLGRLSEHDGPMVVGSDGQIIYISSLAEQFYRKVGYSHSLLNHNLTELQTDESVFYKALEGRVCVEQLIQEGPYTWLKRAIPLNGGTDGPIWSFVRGRLDSREMVILTVHDVTEEVQKERELRVKSAMIQEIHHRVKNNLQTIAALLRLQARRTGSPEVGMMLQETINRILSIAIVHEFLAHQESNDVDMREVAHQIISEVTRSILDPEKHVHFTLKADDVHLPTQQATSCALVLNELLHNTVEHGFAHTTQGNVRVRLDADGERIICEITDNGQGLPADFKLPAGGSLGLQIVQTLVREDLKGTFQLVNAEGGGARAIVTFPLVPSAPLK